MKISTIINYTFIFFVLFRNVLTRLGDVPGLAGVALILFVLTLFANKSRLERKVWFQCLFSPPVVIWLIWVIYSWINWEIKGLPPNVNLYGHYISRFILPIAILWTVYYEGCRNLHKVLNVIVAATALYCLLGILFQESGAGLRGATLEVARGGAAMGNFLALTGCCLSFYACFSYANGFISRRALYCFLLLALASILFVSTRKALGGYAIVLLSWGLTQVDLRKPKNIMTIALLSVITVVGYAYIMDNTLMGARFQDLKDFGGVSRGIEVPKYLHFLGERGPHYLLGFQLFLTSPITGIGLGNFQNLTDYPVQLHTEYMTQLCEGGIVGTLIWAFFMMSMLKVVWNRLKKRNKDVAILCAGGLALILFLNITAWTYDHVGFFSIYGLILAYCKPLGYRHLFRNKIHKFAKDGLSEIIYR